MTDLTRLYQRLAALRHVKRFQRFPLLWPESVAEHSFYAAVLAATFADQIRTLLGDTALDGEAVVRGALWHDTAETFTGDIPHDVKRQHPELQARFEELEVIVEASLLRQAGGSWRGPDHDSLEYKLIKMADCFELLLYVATERAAGNLALEVPAQKIWTILRVGLRERIGKHGPQVVEWYDNQLNALAAGLHGEPI